MKLGINTPLHAAIYDGCLTVHGTGPNLFVVVTSPHTADTQPSRTSALRAG
jgi:hypothetical protein